MLTFFNGTKLLISKFAQPVVLPSISFPTKKKATNFFKEMLNRYVDGQEIEPSDHILLYELLLRHPTAADKIGKGVKRFFRQKSHDHPTSCFHLERIDDMPTDFSYIECISSFDPTLEQYFYRACRQSVSEILTTKKNELFDIRNVRCSKTWRSLRFCGRVSSQHNEKVTDL